jgi:hypothetical protein
MAQVPKRLLIPVLILLTQTIVPARRFFPDDPITGTCPQLPVAEVQPNRIDEFTDFIKQSGNGQVRPPQPALGVNTLGEVFDSAWFTNRHGSRRMTPEELRRGPGDSHPPQPPFVVLTARMDGKTPRFEIRDAAGEIYFLKPDPGAHPELATSADVIGARFFYALGYNTPENYLVSIQRDHLTPAEDARMTGTSRKRPIDDRGLTALLDMVRRSDGDRFRMVASRRIPGEIVGPFEFSGIREDDPNDFIPHERRRDLRGLHVFAAWLNYTDAAAPNTLDSIVEIDAVRAVRHYLLDFDSTLGSDRDQPKDARYGNAFIVPPVRELLIRMVTFGAYVAPWERADYPGYRAVGRFEFSAFDPDQWFTNYPNPAFLSRQPDDEYWATKIVLNFSEDDIRTIVQTGRYSQPEAADYITHTLCERRLRIARTYLTKVLPLDGFRIEKGRLRFADLGVTHGIVSQRSLAVTWSRFNNETETHTPLVGARTFEVPFVKPGEYIAARVIDTGDRKKSVVVYIRDNRVIGIERSW